MRIDVAVLGRSAGVQGWYGAAELKWPKLQIDTEKVRQSVVEDAVRVAFSETTNMRANFYNWGNNACAGAAVRQGAHEFQERQAKTAIC